MLAAAKFVSFAAAYLAAGYGFMRLSVRRWRSPAFAFVWAGSRPDEETAVMCMLMWPLFVLVGIVLLVVQTLVRLAFRMVSGAVKRAE